MVVCGGVSPFKIKVLREVENKAETFFCQPPKYVVFLCFVVVVVLLFALLWFDLFCLFSLDVVVRRQGSQH